MNELKEKYQTINDLFGIDKQVLINDFKAISAAIEKNETFEYYEELGKIARKQYPETLLGTYYLGRFYEETGEPKKAMRTYQSAYTLMWLILALTLLIGPVFCGWVCPFGTVEEFIGKYELALRWVFSNREKNSDKK